jgi:hypothetical protein
MLTTPAKSCQHELRRRHASGVARPEIRVGKDGGVMARQSRNKKWRRPTRLLEVSDPVMPPFCRYEHCYAAGRRSMMPGDTLTRLLPCSRENNL